jgi:hypothetical protein
MSPLEAAALIAMLALPLHGLVLLQLYKLDDPAYLREHGVVIVIERALEGHGESIGAYQGHEIWATVTFKGMTYRFSRVERPRYRHRVAPRELYLDPGLVYLTD